MTFNNCVPAFGGVVHMIKGRFIGLVGILFAFPRRRVVWDFGIYSFQSGYVSQASMKDHC